MNPGAASTPPPGLSPEGQRIFLSVVAALRPRGAPLATPKDREVAETALSFIPYMPAPARIGLRVALRILDLAPVLRGFGFRRMSSMSTEDAGAYLLSWEHGPVPMDSLYQGLRSLILISFYQQPSVLQTLNVDWAGHADRQIARRASLLAEDER